MVVNFTTYLTQGYAMLLLNIPLEGIPSTFCLWSIIVSLWKEKTCDMYAQPNSLYISPKVEPFFGTGYEIWATFGPVGCTENFGMGLTVCNFFYCLTGKIL